MPIRGIVFDKDGTLLDFNATWIPVTRAVAMIIADGNADVAAKMLDEAGQDEALGVVRSGSLLAVGTNHQIAESWKSYAPHKTTEELANLIDGVGVSVAAYAAKAVPDMETTVRRFAKTGLKIGLATSDSYESAREMLVGFEILDAFDFVCGYDSGFGIKPGPGMVVGFCEATGCRPEDICVVGDNPHDMEMAIAADVALRVGVLTGTSEADHLLPLAHHVIPSIAGLSEIIDAFNSGENL